jgi:hypothetical protein
MIGNVLVEGHAIVSEDGMIADALGNMPTGLQNEADWKLFQAALDRAALVVLGRLGHTRHPNPGRRRLVLTHQIAAFEPDPADSLATFWNPAGMPIATVLDRLGVRDGVLAITGGTGAFDHFLPLYDRFLLAEVSGLHIVDGTWCFSEAMPREALSAAGMKPGLPQLIDPQAGVTLTDWRR